MLNVHFPRKFFTQDKEKYIEKKKTCTRMFTTALFLSVQNLKQSKCPSTREEINSTLVI